ncbi:MAG: Smr/MutS family protein [Nitrospirae bacterium]|nr:Smr/MutS family protein [Nitrospirota bacterium]
MNGKKQGPEILVTDSFKELKKIYRRKKAQIPQRPASVQKTKSPDDEDFFLNTMKEVQEIREFREIPLYHKKVVPPSKKKLPDNEVLKALKDTVSGRKPLHLPDTQEYVEWTDKEHGGDILKNLHAGKYSVQDCLDLHGVIVEEAEKEVDAFIRDSVKRGRRCVKIIHGRGLCSPNGPVLKDIVVKWLSMRYRKYISAFVTARQCDGGLGALYVLFK